MPPARSESARQGSAAARLPLVPLPAIHAGFRPAITRRQSPPSLLPRLPALAAVECGLWLGARDPEARRHYWQGPELEALRENTLADLDHRGVELHYGTFVEAPQRLFLRQPLAVRPVGRHRVVRVADEYDPRLDRDVLASLAVGIAGAVVALVAVPNDRPDFFEPVD